MENVVLGLLILQSLSIYGLYQAFKQGISMFYSASYGSLQIAVKNLLSKGMIIVEEQVDQGRNKKIYSITDKGRQAFFAWMGAEIPVNKLEVTALSKVYFLGLVESKEQQKQIILQILDKVEQVQRELGTMNEGLSTIQVPAGYASIFKYNLKTLDYGIQAHVFARQWFLALLEELG